MADEFEEPQYSAFVPILIFLIAFAISGFYQVYEVLLQRDALNTRYNAEAPNISKATDAQNRLVAFMNDLVATAGKDANAAQIIQEAKQAGIIRENAKGTNGAPAAPAASQ
jgi:hypothetical protein